MLFQKPKLWTNPDNVYMLRQCRLHVYVLLLSTIVEFSVVFIELLVRWVKCPSAQVKNHVYGFIGEVRGQYFSVIYSPNYAVLVT